MSAAKTANKRSKCKALLKQLTVRSVLKPKYDVIFYREREKLTQREELWQQVESLAKSNPEWTKTRRFDDSLGSTDSKIYEQYNENCDLTYDKLEQQPQTQQQQQSRAQAGQLKQQPNQEPREVRQALATLTTLHNY